MQPITQSDIDKLNETFSAIRITARPHQLRQLRLLCASHDVQDIYRYPTATPLTFAHLTGPMAASFNHPVEPLGLVRGQGYLSSTYKPTRMVQTFNDELNTAIHRTLGQAPFTTFDIDFRDALYGQTQRESGEYHVDGYSISSAYIKRQRYIVGDLLMAIVNGDDGPMNTIGLNGRWPRMLTELEKITQRHNQSREKINHAFEQHLTRMDVRTGHYAGNAVTLLFKTLDPHRSATNFDSSSAYKQRSFARLSH